MPRLDRAAELIGDAAENPQAKRLLEETVNFMGDLLKGRLRTGPANAESVVDDLRKSGMSVNARIDDLHGFSAIGENGEQVRGIVPKDGGFLQIGAMRHPEVTTWVRGASNWSDSKAIGTSFDFTASQDVAVRKLGDLGLRIRLVAPKAPTVSFAETNKMSYEPAVKSEFDWLPLFTTRTFRGQEMRTATTMDRASHIPDVNVAVADSISLRGINAWNAGKSSQISIKGLADSEDFDNFRNIRTKL